ncbi:MAG: transposase DNA-binding-containing protein [Alphaproteobacteria bacterium]|nr:transposase DNA-binding-containing protein [Alphaproteobacteria bacterium]
MRDEAISNEAAWQEEELSAAALPDRRLARRLRRLLDQLSAAPDKPIPAACGDWAAAKAARGGSVSRYSVSVPISAFPAG